MMAPTCIGHLAMITKQKLIGIVFLWMLAPLSLAAPAPELDEALAVELSLAEGAWTEIMTALPKLEGQPYDEQIFTELSPIVDSPEALKLPEDQQRPE